MSHLGAGLESVEVPPVRVRLSQRAAQRALDAWRRDDGPDDAAELGVESFEERVVVLRTFQPRSRVGQLESDGVLLADWAWVSPGLRGGYRGMVAAMTRWGVDSRERPPIWCWFSDLCLFDAVSLLDAHHQLSTGYATVEVEAPAARRGLGLRRLERLSRGMAQR